MTKLDELLSDARALEVRAKQDRLAAIAGQVEQARAAVIAAFDGLWDEIAPHADGGHYRLTGDDNGVSIWWTVINVPGLVEFSAVAQLSYGRLPADACYLSPYDDPSGGSRGRTAFARLPEFLLERKQAHEQAADKALAKRIAEAGEKLGAGGYVGNRVHTPAEADAALAELAGLAPERSGEWQAMRRSWQYDFDRQAAKRAEEEAEAAQRHALYVEYETVFSAYWLEYRRVLLINEGRLDDLQAALDQPFKAWKLEYAYCAGDDEGNQFAATETAWALSDEPDSDGYWSIADGEGGLARRRFYNLVSISAPYELRPAQQKVFDSVTLDGPNEYRWYTLYFHPCVECEDVAAQAAALLDPWPVRPQEPEGIDVYDSARIRRQIAGHDPDCPF